MCLTGIYDVTGTYQCSSEMCVWLAVFSGLGPRGRLTSTLRGEKNSIVKSGNGGSMGIVRRVKNKHDIEEQNRTEANSQIQLEVIHDMTTA